MGPDSDGVEIHLVSATHSWGIFSAGVRVAMRLFREGGMEIRDEQTFWRECRARFKLWHQGYVVAQERKRERRVAYGQAWKSHQKGAPDGQE